MDRFVIQAPKFLIYNRQLSFFLFNGMKVILIIKRYL